MDLSYIILQAAMAEEPIRYGGSKLMIASKLFFLVLQLILTISFIVIYRDARHRGFTDSKGAAKSIFQVVKFSAITASIFLLLHIMAYLGLIFN